MLLCPCCSQAQSLAVSSLCVARPRATSRDLYATAGRSTCACAPQTGERRERAHRASQWAQTRAHEPVESFMYPAARGKLIRVAAQPERKKDKQTKSATNARTARNRAPCCRLNLCHAAVTRPEPCSRPATTPRAPTPRSSFWSSARSDRRGGRCALECATALRCIDVRGHHGVPDAHLLARSFHTLESMLTPRGSRKVLEGVARSVLARVVRARLRWHSALGRRPVRRGLPWCESSRRSCTLVE